MKNYKITVAYDGAKYNGWQKQGNTSNTMQERFEKVLERMCAHPVEIHASGRTDAGVHAISQTANFKCNTRLKPMEIKDYLNKYLPEDILVKSCEVADERFHARLNAVSKTYEYLIATEKPDVFVRKYVWVAENKPDVESMRKAAEKLLGTHDFKGFSTGKTKKSTVRTINWLEIEENNGIIAIRVNGNGFLYNMVRIISGTLYDIGTGKLDVSVIDEIFESKIRENAGQTLPPQGLKVVEVLYQ
ncbi:MAG: tRNA pseudouridine(38-40) synthase TruA [Clostridia bacterium]|nr:tRNA pseudouridine(38-40) synthase TruA [Clostridia bacterium]